VLGFAADLGGPTSHTAIVARGLGIPAVVGLDSLTSAVSPGDMLILDGTHGVVIVDPDEAQIAEYREQGARRVALIRSLEELRDLPAETRDGVRVELYGNIEFPEEVATCIAKGATGIGLFRTEFLFLRDGPEPTEEDQFQVYRQVAESLEGRPLVIRTLDLGADKYTHRADWEREPNPFLGLRSIRYCLQHREVFWPQLRAILRASVHGNIKIMFPMISRVMELRQAHFLLKLAMEELEEEGFEIRTDIPIGAMVETPSAALCAAHLAHEVKFLSIGTNDLVQYTLAVDRSNERVAFLYTPHDPAVLRLIRNVVRQGRGGHVDVSLCGEIAGDPMSTILLIGMGLRCLSMSAVNIPEVKKIIRSIRFADARQVAKHVFRFETEREVVNYLRDETRRVLPDAL
jgi:phosphotransferase system enzyme I (PtsI)